MYPAGIHIIRRKRRISSAEGGIIRAGGAYIMGSRQGTLLPAPFHRDNPRDLRELLHNRREVLSTLGRDGDLHLGVAVFQPSGDDFMERHMEVGHRQRHVHRQPVPVGREDLQGRAEVDRRILRPADLNPALPLGDVPEGGLGVDAVPLVDRDAVPAGDEPDDLVAGKGGCSIWQT